MPLGIFTLSLIVLILAIVVAVIAYHKFYNSRVRRFGFASRSEYFLAVPRSDAEKQEAVDQALKGLVICILGLIFPPLFLIGLFPLFIGCRKAIWSSMGLGLTEDPDQPGT